MPIDLNGPAINRKKTLHVQENQNVPDLGYANMNENAKVKDKDPIKQTNTVEFEDVTVSSFGFSSNKKKQKNILDSDKIGSSRDREKQEKIENDNCKIKNRITVICNKQDKIKDKIEKIESKIHTETGSRLKLEEKRQNLRIKNIKYEEKKLRLERMRLKLEIKSARLDSKIDKELNGYR